MEAKSPKHIDLTDEEQALASEILFDPDPHRDSDDAVQASCGFAHRLTQLLLNRNAIPQIRWAFFTKPEYNVGTKKSRLQIFDSNGTTGEEIFRHPHFLKYLKYFIYGPDLPPETITEFCDIINHRILTSGMELDELCKFARSEIRKRTLDKQCAAEAFYQLCLECGQEFNARTIRDAAKQTR